MAVATKKPEFHNGLPWFVETGNPKPAVCPSDHLILSHTHIFSWNSDPSLLVLGIQSLCLSSERRNGWEVSARVLKRYGCGILFEVVWCSRG